MWVLSLLCFKWSHSGSFENVVDMFTFGNVYRSRLGCQVITKPELDGVRLDIPSATRNFAIDGFVPEPH